MKHTIIILLMLASTATAGVYAPPGHLTMPEARAKYERQAEAALRAGELSTRRDADQWRRHAVKSYRHHLRVNYDRPRRK